MTCDSITSLLDDYLDGLLPQEEVTRVETHLTTCAECRAEVAALRSVLADARGLPRAVLPARDLWTGIEARLEKTSRGKADSRTGDVRLSGRPPVRRFPLPLLAAAAIALVLSGAGLATIVRRGPDSTGFALEQRRYAEATAELARQVTRNPEALPEATRAVVERNLAIVDEAIHEAEQALTSDPGNTALEQMVLARYEQRLALLRRATQAGRQEL